MQACKRWGHIVTDTYDTHPSHRQNFCDRCGSSTVYKCSYCGAKIRGYYHVDGVIGGGGPDVPLNCHSCGRGYAWKNKVLVKIIAIKCASPAKYLLDGVISIFKK
jgi:hypothetical protein